MKKHLLIVLIAGWFTPSVFLASDLSLEGLASVSDESDEDSNSDDSLLKGDDVALKPASSDTSLIQDKDAVQAPAPKEEYVQEDMKMQDGIIQSHTKLAQATSRIANLLNNPNFVELSDEDKEFIDSLKKSAELNRKAASAHQMMKDLDEQIIKIYQAGYQPSAELLTILSKLNKKIISISTESVNDMVKNLQFKPIYRG